jgi:hypothetical protein
MTSHVQDPPQAELSHGFPLQVQPSPLRQSLSLLQEVDMTLLISQDCGNSSGFGAQVGVVKPSPLHASARAEASTSKLRRGLAMQKTEHRVARRKVGKSLSR